MGPEGGREPGVEHVGITHRLRLSARVSQFRWVLQSANKPLIILFIASPHDIMAPAKALLQIGFRATSIPNRNPMPPPQLSANAPIPLLAQPIQIRPRIAR